MASNQHKIETVDELMQRLDLPSAAELAQARNNKMLKPNDALSSDSAEEPSLHAAVQAWEKQNNKYNRVKAEKLDTLKELGDNSNPEADSTEINQLQKDILNTEYKQSQHIEAGYANQNTSLHVSPHSVKYREYPINNMIYSNDGKPPRPDLSKSAVARQLWVLDTIKDIQGFLLNTKENMNQWLEKSTIIAKELTRASGAAIIDSIGPSPAKLLPLTKTRLPSMDYLRDGILDESASRAGIKTPGSAIMDNILGPSPYTPTKSEHKLLDSYTSLPTDNKNISNQTASLTKTQLNNTVENSSSLLAHELIQKELVAGNYTAQMQATIMAQVNHRLAQQPTIEKMPNLAMQTDRTHMLTTSQDSETNTTEPEIT